MAGHCDRFNQRSLLERKIVRQTMQRMGGDGPQTLHGAGRVDADKFQLLANVTVAGAASGATAARVERPDSYPVAWRPSADAVARSRDGSGHFVSNHLRKCDDR